MPKSTDNQYSDQEAERRRDEALRRALSMPPKPHKKPSKKKGAARRPQKAGN
jgi:hypothetical protein